MLFLTQFQKECNTSESQQREWKLNQETASVITKACWQYKQEIKYSDMNYSKYEEQIKIF